MPSIKVILMIPLSSLPMRKSKFMEGWFKKFFTCMTLSQNPMNPSSSINILKASRKSTILEVDMLMNSKNYKWSERVGSEKSLKQKTSSTQTHMQLRKSPLTTKIPKIVNFLIKWHSFQPSTIPTLSDTINLGLKTQTTWMSLSVTCQSQTLKKSKSCITFTKIGVDQGVKFSSKSILTSENHRNCLKKTTQMTKMMT